MNYFTKDLEGWSIGALKREFGKEFYFQVNDQLLKGKLIRIEFADKEHMPTTMTLEITSDNPMRGNSVGFHPVSLFKDYTSAVRAFNEYLEKKKIKL